MLTAGPIHYELSERVQGLEVGGIGLLHRVVQRTGLIEAIDRGVRVLKVHLP